MKKFLTFIKDWWQTILAAIVSLYAYFAISNAKKQKIKSDKEMEETINKLQKLNEEEKQKLQTIQKRYDEVIGQLKEKYEAENKKIEDWQRKEIATIIATTRLNPEEKAKKIAEKYGIRYVE